jgi:hypothetical protein
MQGKNEITTASDRAAFRGRVVCSGSQHKEYVRGSQSRYRSEVKTMKFSRILCVPLLAVVVVFSAAASYSAPVVTADQTSSAHSKKPARFHYVCPMHEDVTSKTAGKKCPKCKMKLERRRVKEPTETQQD